MKRLAILSVTVAIVLMSSAVRAVADDQDNKGDDKNDPIVLDQAAISAPATLTPITDSLAEQAARLAADPQGARPVAIEYSDAHETRAKIHRYVSWAVLPLMATEFALGQSLYNDPNSTTSNLRGVHGAVGAGLIGVFAAQSITGVWNLLEEGGAPGQKKRLVHGFMMLAAEGGFIAAAAMAPGHSRNDLVNFDANKSTHRNVAVVSIGVGTAGYLLMLLTKNH
jgi:hypothetical protein